MYVYYRNISLLWLLILVTGCFRQPNEAVLPEVLDYSSDDMWFDAPFELKQKVDIFYILPTCVWDWKDMNGIVHHFADVNKPEQRQAMLESFVLAREIFADSCCNFFAPYYRQITLESWIEGDSVISERFPFAMQDINAAFDNFISYKNNGRPFILAGFSQGAKGVVELLKEMPTDVCKRMIAAYVIGYRVTDADLESNGNIIGATNSSDIGVTICYNSVQTIADVCPVLSPSAICINPINWKIDDTLAMMNDSVDVRMDETNKVLIVSGLDSSLYYEPLLHNLFKEGCYHLQELLFYQDYLKDNVSQRIESYYNNKRRKV